MESCCSLCDKVLQTGAPHPELALLSELTESKIYKCHVCKTFIHFSLGDWEIMIPSPLDTIASKQKTLDNRHNNKPQQLAS